MRTYTTIIGLAACIWLVPFLVSFGFYTPTGELLVPFLTFKLVMIGVATLTSLGVFWWYFGKVRTMHLGMIMTITLAVNSLLDLGVLVGLLGMDLNFWLRSVLPVYVVMIPVSIGFMAFVRAKNTKAPGK